MQEVIAGSEALAKAELSKVEQSAGCPPRNNSIVVSWGAAPKIPRQKVLDEAKSWLGTPFEHMQRCKGAGVDCGQFLLGVFHNTGCIPYVKPDYYPKDFHLHQDREWYKEMVEEFAEPLPLGTLPLPADVVLFRVGRLYSHGAIVVLWPKIIHSFVTNGVVIADATQGMLANKHRKFYRPKMLERV